MKIYLVPFAMFKEAFPENPLPYEIPEGTTAQELMDLLKQDFPEVAGILPYTRLAHQDEYIVKDLVLKDNEEYCLIPPVSGG